MNLCSSLSQGGVSLQPRGEVGKTLDDMSIGAHELDENAPMYAALHMPQECVSALCAYRHLCKKRLHELAKYVVPQSRRAPPTPVSEKPPRTVAWHRPAVCSVVSGAAVEHPFMP